MKLNNYFLGKPVIIFTFLETIAIYNYFPSKFTIIHFR